MMPAPRNIGLIATALSLVLLALGGHAWQTSAQRVAVAKAITGGDPARAPDLVRRYGCGGCHTVPGIAGADGKVAPPLEHLRARVFIGGAARNSADNLVRWIVAPQSFAPHSAMPATGIGAEEARDVAAYLYSR
jgi:cytochrome c2